MEEILLGILGLQEAKDVQLKLKNQGVEVQLKSNPKTCSTGGCSITVELWGLEQDLEVIKVFFGSEFAKNLEGHDVNYEALNEVFDPNASEVTCQACGAKFKPTASECPDCGLVY
jgi:hypothetical protein